MCLGVPGLVVEVDELTALVDFWGVRRRVRLDLVDEPVAIGDYVLNHVGFAIRRIPPGDIEGTLALYEHGVHHAEACGIILADTKFEFGLTESGDAILIDEVMTPDSSRYWPKDQYAPGGAQPSFDKQYVRDYLEEIRWNKQPPVPELPDTVVRRTREKYLEAFRRLTGKDLE